MVVKNKCESCPAGETNGARTALEARRSPRSTSLPERPARVENANTKTAIPMSTELESASSKRLREAGMTCVPEFPGVLARRFPLFS